MPTKPHAEGKRVATRKSIGRLPRGYGEMRDVALALDPRIDLTKPIYEQAAALGLATQRPRAGRLSGVGFAKRRW